MYKPILLFILLLTGLIYIYMHIISTKSTGFYDINTFPSLSTLNKTIIKSEFRSLNNKNWIDWPEYELWNNTTSNTTPSNHTPSNTTPSWQVIPLMAFRKWSKKNINLYPKTYKELKKIPGLITAGFSKLGPGTSLSYHKGWANLSNNVLRCHLGIEVPEKRCRILVKPDNIKTYYKYQKEDEWIIFDDSLTHSADNNSKKDRIVLILDIKRPKHIKKGISTVQNSPELENFLNQFNQS